MSLIRSRSASLSLRLAAAALLGVATAALLQAQIPGRNVNMVSGTTLPDGDPFVQRQDEPSAAASTRNPLHLLAGANDYRTVDLPGLEKNKETGDAWMGVFKSNDGGNTWRSTLIPGYPQDPNKLATPLYPYEAAADPVVRAGTNGLFFYSGIVFVRDSVVNGTTVKGKSAMFVSRFIDNNNLEAGDPIVFLDTKLIATNDGTAFIDKPWFAVDRPRAGAQTCTINTTQPNPRDPADPITTQQTFPGGAAYAAYSLITGEGVDTRSQIYLSRSLDCGASWSAPQQISSSLDPINQGATLAIDPTSGVLYLAWRRFSADGTDDSIMVTRSMDQGRKWDPPGRARRFPRGKKKGLDPELHGKKFKQPLELTQLASFDQPTAPNHFRTNAYPTMTVDGGGRVYVAWSERGFAPNSDLDEGDARILVATSTNGAAWSNPILVDNTPVAGHQIMPSISFAGGKLMLAYYDFQHDVSGVFTKFVDEILAVLIGHKRHTVDVRAAMASPGLTPTFGPSVRVSEYLMGSRPGTGPRPVEQLQFNPPNLKLFQLGSVPFFGDYIDLAPSPSFVPTAGGGWEFNTAPSSSPLFHVVWTDNRDVVPPADGDWTKYAPPGAVVGSTSFYDPTILLTQGCDAAADPTSPNNRAGMRNQNIYTARLTGGLVAGAPGNSKPLHPILPRGFAVFAQNATEVTKIFRMTIENQPIGGGASFLQASLLPSSNPPAPPPPHVLSVDVMVPRRSTVARNVFATSTNPDAQINVSVKEIASVGGGETAGGLQSTVVLNPDISNPDISNPDISNPDISNPDISNAEVANPDISNPDISNPDISNPDISNPDISNPDISNVPVANPDISNPDISNPDISNPDISNPDISNPDISNPDISNQSLTDTTWTVTNDGNTTTSYSVKLLLDGEVPDRDQIVLQLLLHKVSTSPVAVNCSLVNHPTNVLQANIINPAFTDPADVGNPDISNPDISNATLWLAPGESAKITLRTFDTNIFDGVEFDAAELVTPVVVPPALDVAIVNGELVVGADVDVAVSLNAEFLNVPAAGEAGIPIGNVGVRVMDDQGEVLPEVNVTLSVRTLATNAQIGVSQVALSSLDGIAGFTIGALPAGTYRLLAQVTRPDFPPASAWSDPFVIAARDVRQWTIGNGNYYEYVRIGGLSWTQARDAAAARSFNGIPGRLVTITSASENTFVNGLGDGGELRAWIGMFDPDGPDDIFLFSWITGEPVGYTNWSVGEPNNPGTEFWVEMFTDGTWNNNVVSDPIYPTLGYMVEYQAAPPTILVSSTADSGPGTLRQAILTANANGPSHDTIAFNLPGGPVTIALSSALPAITQPLTINGTTQPGFSGSPLVFITRAGDWSGPGLRVEAANSVVRSIGVTGFGGPGIQLWSGANLVVAGNYIGINSAGNAVPNTVGVEVVSLGSRIGGSVVADRNVISGNTGAGIFVTDQSGGTIIDMNFIGINPTGAALPNGGGGIFIDTTTATIGGTAPTSGNVISGNTGNGILISNGPAGLTIKNNYIGVGLGGTTDVGNTLNGIRLNGNSTGVIIGAPAQGNVISGNGENGVYLDLDSHGNFVTNNLIGTDVTGTLRIGNGTIQPPAFDLVGAGVVINGFENQIGGPSQANVISANGTGISLTGTADDNIIQGNLIGTTANGQSALGNRFGIFNSAAAGTLIGGPAFSSGNTVSGNSVEGITVTGERASDIVIQGNRIGTNYEGLIALSGNTFGGVTVRFGARATIGGAAPGAGNVISGNSGAGVRLETFGNSVVNNIIGMDAAQSGPLGNGNGGLSIAANGTTIDLNLIAHNTGVGINASGSGNAILGNAIFSNGGLGIDQGGDGVTANDGSGDAAPQNYPLLTAATTIPGGVRIQGDFSSTPNTLFQIRFFVSPSCDASGFGEGQTQVGSVQDISTNSDGSLTVDFNFLVPVTIGHFITATARNQATNDTSEFSECRMIETTAPPVPLDRTTGGGN